MWWSRCSTGRTCVFGTAPVFDSDSRNYSTAFFAEGENKICLRTFCLVVKFIFYGNSAVSQTYFGSVPLRLCFMYVFIYFTFVPVWAEVFVLLPKEGGWYPPTRFSWLARGRNWIEKGAPRIDLLNEWRPRELRRGSGTVGRETAADKKRRTRQTGLQCYRPTCRWNVHVLPERELTRLLGGCLWCLSLPSVLRSV